MADYYSMLGVSRGATEKEIRSAFRKLARKHHPDVNDNDPASEEKFKQINEAYTVLSDTDSRRKYDRYGDDWKRADQFNRGGGGFSHFDMGGMGGGRRSIFDQFFGGMGGQEVRPPAPAEYKVEVSLEEAFTGAARRLQMQDQRRLEVKIPPGVDNGSKVHIAAESTHGGAFYLVITVKDHAKFRRQGKDLYVEVEAPLEDAILGGEMTVPTLTGKLALIIPQGTQNGRRFRLAGQGMPTLSLPANQAKSNVNQRGDLFATLKVKLPTEFTEQELNLFKKLRDLRSKSNRLSDEIDADRNAANDETGKE
ncbi:MAG: J domain-containing protein [Chloroflexota bacterium]|nr:J domain-containing protein [Dehalococcoidia bacterium]MEE3014260.1 J domain-containing protein [Chloroflexota bacterium]GIS94162.1 MAG: molecular chaperone DnaJ [Dehalococcoidia bacterium]|tara:strand:+ start:1119 stop:2045 length:927 start_codon:yes stop_codon:yes gene_type:complete